MDYLNAAKKISNASNSTVDMANNLKEALGESTTVRVFNQMAQEDRDAIEKQQRKIDTATGSISSSGSVSIPRNHHYGKTLS